MEQQLIEGSNAFHSVQPEDINSKTHRYLVTAVIETFLVVEVQANTMPQAIAQTLAQLQTTKGVTVEQQGLLNIKASSAIAL